MHDRCFPADAFGDPYDLNDLPLARPAVGYAVQWLGTDRLLDIATGQFLPVRSRHLQAAWASFAEAHAAAAAWSRRQATAGDLPPLAIIPVGYDALLERHVLIYGVLCAHP